MKVFCSFNLGYDSILTEVEVDFKQGIPGIQIVGYAGTAVKESADRVRLAIKNSDIDYPLKKIYVNLYPGSYKKESAYFDVAIAIKIIEKSGYLQESDLKFMILGELKISGEVCRSEGVLASVSSGVENGIKNYIIPVANFNEASGIKNINIFPVENLVDAVDVIGKIINNEEVKKPICFTDNDEENFNSDILDIEGQQLLKKSLIVSAYGFHSLFLQGAPGCGKTMAIERLATLLPTLNETDALETTKIYSIAGKLSKDKIIKTAPIRIPHHSASLEGLIGGGSKILPGEISLANNGILFLDEAGEFSCNAIQALREPMEKRKIFIARAGLTAWFPAKFILAIATNLCPCGNRGKDNSICLCSNKEIQRYRNKIGGAIQDRIDITLFMKSRDNKIYFKDWIDYSSKEIRDKIENLQKKYIKIRGKKNSFFDNSDIKKFCSLNSDSEFLLNQYVKENNLSYRAQISILRVARSVADLDLSENIEIKHLEEAFLYRND